MKISSKSAFLYLIISTVVLLNVAGCGPSPSNSVNEAQNAASPAPNPKKMTPDDLAKLRWIEGTWRGTGETQGPFYERYHFENDSALVMENLADETLSKVTETTRYELKDGQFGNGRSVATDLDDKSVTFSPLLKGYDSYRFQTESKDTWKAILTLPASGTSPAKETVYKMVRFPAPKQ